MARPRKQTVDYFPHYCVHGKTMFILEERYGNNGYAFWFKLLELLGNTEGHYIDCNDPATWEFLLSKTRLTGDICEEILSLLAKLMAIDPELWEEKVIWSENFVIGVTDAYRNRKLETPRRPDFLRKKSISDGISDATEGVSDVRNPQMKLNEIKLDKIKNTSDNPEPFPFSSHPPPASPDGDAQNLSSLKPKSKRKSKPIPAGKEGYSPDFEAFWSAMIHRPRDPKEGAFKKWERLRKRKELPPLETLLQAARNYNEAHQATDREYLPAVRTFLDEKRWENYLEPEPGASPNGTGPPKPKLLPARPDCAVCNGTGLKTTEIAGQEGEIRVAVETCPCCRGENTPTKVHVPVFPDKDCPVCQGRGIDKTGEKRKPCACLKPKDKA